MNFNSVEKDVFGFPMTMAEMKALDTPVAKALKEKLRPPVDYEKWDSGPSNLDTIPDGAILFCSLPLELHYEQTSTHHCNLMTLILPYVEGAPAIPHTVNIQWLHPKY